MRKNGEAHPRKKSEVFITATFNKINIFGCGPILDNKLQ